MKRRTALAALAGLASTGTQAQQPGAFPGGKPVHILVGFSAGTTPDIAARILAQKLSETWNGAAVVVDNKPGAGGIIAAGEAARAPADGYTLMLADTGQLAIAPSSYNKLPYDAQRDFVAVAQVVTADMALLVNPQKVPAQNIRELVDWARARKALFMATFGAGTPGHFGAVMLGDALKFKPDIVHFKSAGEAINAMLSGDVQAILAGIALALPHVKAGRLTALATTGTTRAAALPEVPTFKEQGLPELAFSPWFGVVAPALTAPAVVARLNADILKALRTGDGPNRLEQAGFGVTGTSAEDFARIIAADTLRWRHAVVLSGFRAD